MNTFNISGPGLTLIFEHLDSRLSLIQVIRNDRKKLLFKDIYFSQEGGVPLGNPLTVVVHDGEYKGTHTMDTFKVLELSYTENHLTAYIKHDIMPMELALEVEVEGNVAIWRGQACWTGNCYIEADFYYPFFSKINFGAAEKTRAIIPRISGSVLEPISEINFFCNYMGSMSSPSYIIEGDGHGLAVLDDNRADFAADPGACVKRAYIIGNDFRTFVEGSYYEKEKTLGGNDGPFTGVCHSRLFNPISKAAFGQSEVGFENRDTIRENGWAGDYADFGPVRTYTFSGTWKSGATWLRNQRQHVPFRVSPAKWYQNTTFISEDMGDELLKKGQNFYDFPKILSDKERLGSRIFHIPGFHDPVKIGSSKNFLNRGDYALVAQNLGGYDAVKKGVDAIHRQGGRILYYVEGLIMWSQSRIGISKGRQWALMDADGTYTDHYKGFWHMCPACEDWQNWIAETCAEIVRSTGVDGFFLDSQCATHNHRCYNPEHNHPHPDIWNWGVRRVLRKIREAIDKVNPETILIVEGCSDIAREFADGFVSHSHMWNQATFLEPLVRYLHPDMRVFESWTGRYCSKIPIEALHIWNCVNGYRIYAHNDYRDEMAEISLKTSICYNSYPEICDSRMSELDVECNNCISQLYESTAGYIVTVGNTDGDAVKANFKLPVTSGVLFDRVNSQRVPVNEGVVELMLQPFEFRAFEVRV